MKTLSPRQVHLDFHTSEHIPAVGADFDPAAFARTVQEAAISSVTVFARCHHGWLYYPSSQYPELIHPNLQNPNLLLEQVRALHEVGVRAPVYITVQWDYHSATTRPEWLIRKQDGSHEGDAFTKPGFYQSLCVNTRYYEFLTTHTAEVCTLLGHELDGIFFDIVGVRPCWCAACRAEMKERGIDATDEVAVRDFARMVLDRFKKRMTEWVRLFSDDCTIFYNAGHIGPCTRDSADTYSHFELESLPSGSWGYLHFPVTARYARTLGKDCLGMTGKFHTEWGDFHSLKNQAALEFECFRMLSFGFAASVGDQLEPNGRLNAGTYNLIGKVYRQFAEREVWARPAKALTEAALVTSEDPRFEHRIPDSILGASQMLEELAVQFDLIDPSMALDAYRLIFLPDDLVVSDAFQSKLDAYVAGGGKVIACARGGCARGGCARGGCARGGCANGDFPDDLCFPSSFGVKHVGKNEVFPDFVIPQGDLGRGLEEGLEYVIYQQGETIAPTTAEVILEARAPYFKRSGDWFCSHRYTPSAKGDTYAAATQNGNVILFAHPLFSQYRSNAPFWCKRLIANAIDRLLPERLVRHNGPSTLTVSLLDQPEQNRVCAHLLSYVPVRKSATIDIIEERTRLTDVTLELRLPVEPKTARLVPELRDLEIKDGRICVPEIDGYAIVEIGY